MNKIEKNPSQKEINTLINFLDQNKFDEAEVFVKNLINNSFAFSFVYFSRGGFAFHKHVITCIQNNHSNITFDIRDLVIHSASRL